MESSIYPAYNYEALIRSSARRDLAEKRSGSGRQFQRERKNAFIRVVKALCIAVVGSFAVCMSVLMLRDSMSRPDTVYGIVYDKQASELSSGDLFLCNRLNQVVSPVVLLVHSSKLIFNGLGSLYTQAKSNGDRLHSIEIKNVPN